MATSVKDIAAVIATNRFREARSWYTRLIGSEPDIEPTDGVAEWQLTDTAWLQLVTDPQRAGNSAVRIGVTDLAAQITMLNGAGIRTSVPVVIADMVTVIDIADPDGNEVSYVQEL